MSETFEIKPEYKPKAIRSYVIRAGRITEAQKKAFDRCWPLYGLSLFNGPLDLPVLFARQAPLVLEIGFGMGESLLQMAQQEPEKNFIGIEVHPPGVGRLINEAAKRELTNLKVFMADALDVLEDCIADGAIDRFQLFFPDPWHKKRHHKRRIVQLAFIEKLLPKLAVNGVIHMATDWQPYAEHMLEVLQGNPRLTNLFPDTDYAPRPEHRPLTKFEQRGERLGHGVWDLMFQRIG